MEVPSDGCPAKYGCGKNGAPFSETTKADVHEAWRLWLERGIVKHICFSFSICSFVFKLH